MWASGDIKTQHSGFDWTTFFANLTSACIAAAIAAIGWFIAAAQTYKTQHTLEVEREQRAANALRRVIVSDVRAIIIRLRPWFYRITTVRFDDLLVAYQTLAGDLRDKDFASALKENEYTNLTALLEQFGRDLAYVQSLLTVPDENVVDKQAQRERVAAAFGTTLLPLVASSLLERRLAEEAVNLWNSADSALKGNQYGGPLGPPPIDPLTAKDGSVQ